MKKKKNNFLRNLIFTIIGGFSAICLLGAWTIDNNGNLQSDNLYDFINNECKYQVNNGNISTENIMDSNGNLTIYTNANTSYETGYKIPIERNVQYTFSFNLIVENIFISIYENGTRIIGEYYNNLGLNSITFTTLDIDYNEIILGFSTYEINVGRTIINNLMLNTGTSALPYEPYGTWYSKSNYETLQNEITQLNSEIEDLEEQIDELQNEYDTLLNNIGTISYDISQYSVSVGSVPNPPSFNYTKHQDLSNNFSTIGYLNINEIYTNYIQSGNNNSIYITTPQSNLLTFDLIFNYINAPSTMLKTTLYLPNGNIQQFSYSVDNFQYKEDWTLANLVGSTSIGENFNLNEISYKDLLITYETGNNTLSEIKIGSNNGFNIGFNSGYNTALDRINELTIEINTKTSLLEKANVDLQNKTNEYNMLLARYQQITETPLQLNFQNLIWTIASSPFESFKQIWNVDILGFNIANFVIGVMSVFVVMYIIKKIF